MIQYDIRKRISTMVVQRRVAKTEWKQYNSSKEAEFAGLTHMGSIVI